MDQSLDIQRLQRAMRGSVANPRPNDRRRTVKFIDDNGKVWYAPAGSEPVKNARQVLTEED
jgi:hypothetical protein